MPIDDEQMIRTCRAKLAWDVPQVKLYELNLLGHQAKFYDQENH